MGGPGSGRRVGPKPVKLPPLGDSEADVRVFLRAVAKGQADGSIDPRAADGLTKTCNSLLRSLYQERDRLEMAELREMLAAAKGIAAAGKAREVAEREHLVADEPTQDFDPGDEPLSWFIDAAGKRQPL